MKTYKVSTKWIGYSEIIVDADSSEEAKDKVLTGNFDIGDETMTGTGLGGWDNEQVINVKEVSDGVGNN